MFLGVNGLIVNHPLVGKTFVQIESGVEFIVQNVYAHYYKGWYFFALTINKEQSSAGIYWNINSEKTENEKTFDSLGRFRKKHAMDCGITGCLYCHSSKIFKIKSKKDIIADLKIKEEFGDLE